MTVPVINAVVEMGVFDVAMPLDDTGGIALAGSGQEVRHGAGVTGFVAFLPDDFPPLGGAVRPGGEIGYFFTTG